MDRYPLLMSCCCCWRPIAAVYRENTYEISRDLTRHTPPQRVHRVLSQCPPRGDLSQQVCREFETFHAAVLRVISECFFLTLIDSRYLFSVNRVAYSIGLLLGTYQCTVYKEHNEIWTIAEHFDVFIAVNKQVTIYVYTSYSPNKRLHLTEDRFSEQELTKVWRQIEHPTPSIDAYLHEDHSDQI